MTKMKKGTLPRQQAVADDYRRAPPARPIAELIAELAALEIATRPQDGVRTAEGKDRNAVKALTLANQLVRAVAGWAVDHQMGLALLGQASGPDVPPEMSQHSLHKAVLKIVDQHQHEISGAQGFTKSVSPMTARQTLSNFLQTNPGAFPFKMAAEAIDALTALDYNEVRPIFQPLKGRRKIGLPELYGQLTALFWLSHYVDGRGFKKFEALSRVADAFGISTATLRSWEQRVPKELGALKVKIHLENASFVNLDYEDHFDAELISTGTEYRQTFLSQKK